VETVTERYKFFKCALVEFTLFCGLEDHLLQIQIYFLAEGEDDEETDVHVNSTTEF
jgi:hypothetical protein